MASGCVCWDFCCARTASLAAPWQCLGVNRIGMPNRKLIFPCNHFPKKPLYYYPLRFPRNEAGRSAIPMDSILVKIFATALTFSQVTVRPDAIKTQFDPVQDRPRWVRSCRDGCAHMRKAFDIEDINLDELIATAMDDPQAIAGDMKVLKGITSATCTGPTGEYCKNETVGTRQSISARSSPTTTRRSRTCPTMRA